MSRNGKILLLIALALANVGLLTYIGFRKSAASTANTAAQKEIERLPAVELVDDTGRRFALGASSGRVLVVQFVNPKVSAQVEAVAKAVSAFGAEQASFVLITKDAAALRSRLPRTRENVSVVERDNAELRDAFNVPGCCERRFIFDRGGELLYKDYYYETDLRPRLHSLTDAAPQDFPPALNTALASISSGRFGAIREETRRSRPGKALVILFDSVSTSCPSWEMIKAAGRLAAGHREVPVIALLPKDYTAADVQNLKENLRVDVRVERADEVLDEKWSGLLDVYGEGRMNGSVVLIDRGEVSWLSGFGEAEQALSAAR